MHASHERVANPLSGDHSPARNLDPNPMSLHIEEMLETHPRSETRNRSALVECIEACYSCAQTCRACVDACLAEASVQEMVQCIRLNLDCADVCVATGRLVGRQTGANHDTVLAQLRACITACEACQAECARHGRSMAHCKVCAEECERCAEACRTLSQ